MKKIHIKESSLKNNFNEDLEPISDYEKGVRDIDLSSMEVPDSFKVVNGEIVPNDDYEEDDDEFNMYGIGAEDDVNENPMDSGLNGSDSNIGNGEPELDTKPNQEEDLGFVDDDEEAKKEAEKFIKDKIRSALDPLEELKDFFTHDAYAKSFGGDEYKEHSKKIREVYRELIKVLRNV